MIRFFNNDRFTCEGNPIKEIYKPIVEKDGSVILVVEGHENTDEIIKSYEDSVDIDVIIARYMNGDLEALNKRVGQYGDFTDFPKTYAEVLQMKIDAENVFNELPVDLKAKFNNDPDQFFVQSGSEEWFDKLDPLFKIFKKEEIKEEGNKEE